MAPVARETQHTTKFMTIEMSLTSPDLYEPKSGLVVTISLELLDADETN
jgi:hypothetical protein